MKGSQNNYSPDQIIFLQGVIPWMWNKWINSAKFIFFSVPNSQKLSKLSSQAYFNVVYMGVGPFYYRYAYFNIHKGHGANSMQRNVGGMEAFPNKANLPN